MWKRATWHECADELDEVCRIFRRAYSGKRSKGWPRHPDDVAEMEATSRQGVQLLRALALAVRSEQDFKLVPNAATTVGALKSEGAMPSDAYEVKQRGGYAGMLEINGYTPLSLRQALNKIAHADPQTADYYVRVFAIGEIALAHDLLLHGEDRGKKWFAAISLLELVKAIQALPDAALDPMKTRTELLE